MLQLRLRRSTTVAKKQKTHSAANKYQKSLVSQAKKLKKQEPKAAKNPVQHLMNQFKDIFASEEEIISMTSSVVDYCRLSGCNLLEILYGINETLADDKKHYTTDSIIELFNEHLERLAENDQPDQEEEIEKEFIDLVIKKIEKIAALHKPDSFKAIVLGRINLEHAIEEVE